MAISRYTEILIQGAGDDVTCGGIFDPLTEKFAGELALRVKGLPPIPLVASDYVFATEEEAVIYMAEAVRKIRYERTRSSCVESYPQA